MYKEKNKCPLVQVETLTPFSSRVAGTMTSVCMTRQERGVKGVKETVPGFGTGRLANGRD